MGGALAQLGLECSPACMGKDACQERKSNGAVGERTCGHPEGLPDNIFTLIAALTEDTHTPVINLSINLCETYCD